MTNLILGIAFLAVGLMNLFMFVYQKGIDTSNENWHSKPIQYQTENRNVLKVSPQYNGYEVEIQDDQKVFYKKSNPSSS